MPAAGATQATGAYRLTVGRNPKKTTNKNNHYMKFEDVLGLGKVLPIDKLIEIISKSVGTISKPYFDRKDVDTKVYEIEKFAEARAKEMKIISTAVKENFLSTGGIEYNDDKLLISSPKEFPQDLQQQFLLEQPIETRIQSRLDFQENKKQNNIENITAFATQELKDEEEILNEAIDEDWTTRFFKIAEDISNEEMQSLWGKILAGEIKKPKSYSLRTLDLIKNLSKTEADTFIKVANFTINSNGTNFIFKGSDEMLSKKFNINYVDTAMLIEIGLLQPGDFVQYQLIQNIVKVQNIFTAGSLVILANVTENTPTIQIPVFTLSNSGNELLKLIDIKPPFEYLSIFGKSIISENVEVKYATIIERNESSIRHSQPLLEF